MRGQLPNDLAIAHLAARQDGVVARGQLLAAGLTRRQIGHRRSRIAVHRAVILPVDRSSCHGIPVTLSARTLVDLAHVLDERELTRALRLTARARRSARTAARRTLSSSPGTPC